jgi:hypothetical protein
MPLARLMSKEYAADLRKTISRDRASKSSPATFEWPPESDETTHISVVDAERNAVSMTYNAKEDVLEGGTDRRASDGAAVGVTGRGAQKQTSAQR